MQYNVTRDRARRFQNFDIRRAHSGVIENVSNDVNNSSAAESVVRKEELPSWSQAGASFINPGNETMKFNPAL